MQRAVSMYVLLCSIAFVLLRHFHFRFHICWGPRASFPLRFPSSSKKSTDMGFIRGFMAIYPKILMTFLLFFNGVQNLNLFVLDEFAMMKSADIRWNKTFTCKVCWYRCMQKMQSLSKMPYTFSLYVAMTIISRLFGITSSVASHIIINTKKLFRYSIGCVNKVWYQTSSHSFLFFPCTTMSKA